MRNDGGGYVDSARRLLGRFLPKDDLAHAEPLLQGLATEVGATGFSVDPAIGKVSLVGAGMKSHPGVAAKTFATLEREGIASVVVSTSPIKIACHVPSEQVDTAVRALHEAFDLG